MLYLIDTPLASIGERAARADDSAVVVLIQDGVELSPDLDAPLYAIESDVRARGVTLGAEITPIAYDQLLDLLESHEVRSFV